MARGNDLEAFAQSFDIPIISIEELSEFYEATHPEKIIEVTPALDWADLPIDDRMWKIATYPALRQRDHVILAFNPSPGESATFLRIHSECFTGDVLGSQRCDCGDQLDAALAAIVEKGSGYIIYLRNHEGRGIGLSEKIKAYQLQDQGMDTVEANLALGHQVDSREWSDAIEIIGALGIAEVVLLTSNPEKLKALTLAGIKTSQRHLKIISNAHNEKYIETKASKLGHTHHESGE
jgi:3,4-dihydroxy 2-butanone 4-phosphate synthase/GTP cyclohydrolase II